VNGLKLIKRRMYGRGLSYVGSACCPSTQYMNPVARRAWKSHRAPLSEVWPALLHSIRRVPACATQEAWHAARSQCKT